MFLEPNESVAGVLSNAHGFEGFDGRGAAGGEITGGEARERHNDYDDGHDERVLRGDAFELVPEKLRGGPGDRDAGDQPDADELETHAHDHPQDILRGGAERHADSDGV